MRSAMCAASHLPGRGPTDVAVAPAPTRLSKSNDDDCKTSFLLEKRNGKKYSCSIDNLSRCFMATALSSCTLMSLFTTGGITRFFLGTTFL